MENIKMVKSREINFAVKNYNATENKKQLKYKHTPFKPKTSTVKY